MARSSVTMTKDLRSPSTPGIYYRLICMTGQNKGHCYYLKGNRAVLGRGDQVDIQVMDAKASREHAELTKLKQDYILTDLGSQNGIVINDLKVSQHKMAENDRIIIGQTIYKYQILTIEAPPEAAKSEGEEVAQESQEEFHYQSSAPQPKSFMKLLIMGAVLALGALFLLDTPTDKKPKTDVGTQKKEGIDSPFLSSGKKMSEEDKENEQKIRGVIQQGQRELREGNYFRAIAAFQLATNLDPQNGYAQFYLNKSKESLDNEVKMNFMRASQDVEALKYSSAIVAYCSVLRLLQGYAEDQRYKDALTNIETLEQRLGMEKGETKCFEGQ